MDVELLGAKNVRVLDSQMARLEGYRLRIGARATLVAAPGRVVYGMLMQVPAEDLQRLYSDASVSVYVPQALQVVSADGRSAAATCYVLPDCVKDFLANPAYAQKLHGLAAKLGFPADYLAVIDAEAHG